MLPYCDFDEQQTIPGEDGGILRPDVIVKLPGQQVDRDRREGLAERVSAGARGGCGRRGAARRDGRSREAGARSRPAARARRRTGASCRRRPSSSSCSCTTSRRWPPRSTVDTELYEHALANHVILATPTTLIAVLRAAHYGWQQERIAESAREISDLGRELYKRLSTMGAHVSKLGRSLDGAVKSYNETVGSLERQVLPQARRFEQHGITGIEPPELVPIDRQTRALSAQELVDDSRGRRRSRSRSARPTPALPRATVERDRRDGFSVVVRGFASASGQEHAAHPIRLLP